MLNYSKLWVLLKDKGMQRTDLTKNKVISTATLAKLGKNEPISSTVIEKLCDFLECQPGDIMEYIKPEDVIKAGEMLNQQMSELYGKLEAVTGMSLEAILREFQKELPNIIENLSQNPEGFDFSGVNEMKKKLEEQQSDDEKGTKK